MDGDALELCSPCQDIIRFISAVPCQRLMNDEPELKDFEVEWHSCVSLLLPNVRGYMRHSCFSRRNLLILPPNTEHVVPACPLDMSLRSQDRLQASFQYEPLT